MEEMELERQHWDMPRRLSSGVRISQDYPLAATVIARKLTHNTCTILKADVTPFYVIL